MNAPVNMLRVINFETDDPYFNIALEESLAYNRFYGLIPDTLRIWKNKDSIILGYSNDAKKHVKISEAEKNGIPIIRRFTGGGAVYLDSGCLIYSLAIKRGGGVDIGCMLENLLRGTIIALQKLGFHPTTKNFTDITIKGFKVSGNSAYIRKEGLFLHGTILINSDVDKIYRFLKIPPDNVNENLDPVKYKVTNILSLLDAETTISFSDIINAIIEGYSEALKVTPYNAQLTKTEMKIAQTLHDEKYIKYEWNFMKPSKPSFYYPSILSQE